MLHQGFNQLEAHEQQIGEEIMDQTAEKNGGSVHARSAGTTSGSGTSEPDPVYSCTGYPECSFSTSASPWPCGASR